MNRNLSVAMITMNEEKAVGKVIQDIRQVVPDAEILIVDSSKDETPVIAEKLGAKVIRQFPPQGYGRAMEMALRSASGDVIVTLDCDDTYPVGLIPHLANQVFDGTYDLVDGSRLRRKPKAMPWLNYWANRGFALFASILFGRRITDLHSGMRAYRRSMLEKIEFDASGPALPVELLLKPMKFGYKVGSVFIPYRERIGKSTMQPLPSAWWTVRRMFTCYLA
jgi:glycosyltransferase involved in cell wall biosynthesis